MKPLFFSFPIILLLLHVSMSFADESEISANVLTPEYGYAKKPGEMMKEYLLNEIQDAKNVWQNRYDSLKTVSDVEQYQQQRKDFFRHQLGKMWDRTPLHPQITKTFERGTPGKDAYRVEMVVFESVPNFYVTGALFLPDPTRFKPPYPGVLVVCGHSDDGKAYPVYQQATALAATQGLAALIIDPIDQGERTQHFSADGKPKLRGVPAHNILGAGSILLGRNTATFEVWDMIRALDYLQSRDEIDANRLGVMGNSGGGTQTTYIMALDDRVSVAAPCCFLCSLYGKLLREQGAQDAEQNIFGQLAFGMDHVDYCIMRAPRPTLIETATSDFFPVEDAWATFRNAKRIYDRFGVAEKVSLIEHDAEHGWHKNLREAAVRWMIRWLDGRDQEIYEASDMPIFKPEELRATPDGEVMRIEGARSAFDLNRDYNEELLAARAEKQATRTDAELVAAIREKTGVRPLEEIPEIECESKGTFDISTGTAERLLLSAEQGKILLPAIRFMPKIQISGTVLFLHENSKTADMPRIHEMLRAGNTVLAVDLRGLGETQNVGSNYYSHQLFGTDGGVYYLGYLLGRSYLGMRTEDLVNVARWLRKNGPGNPVILLASGETVGLTALHAAVLEPQLFSGLKLDQAPRSWYDVVQAGTSSYPITNLVHGALLEYDIPDLMRMAKPEF